MQQKNIPPTLSRNRHANLIYVSVWESAQHSGHVANLDGNREPVIIITIITIINNINDLSHFELNTTAFITSQVAVSHLFTHLIIIIIILIS